MQLTKSTLAEIRRKLNMAVQDPIWEQADDQGTEEDEGIAASDEAVELMMASITGVELGDD